MATKKRPPAKKLPKAQPGERAEGPANAKPAKAAEQPEGSSAPGTGWGG